MAGGIGAAVMVDGMEDGMAGAAMAGVAIGVADAGFLGLLAAARCLAGPLIAGGGIPIPAKESGFVTDDAGI